jgi:RNA polymerase sigma-70 factor (ECF subfamily)
MQDSSCILDIPTAYILFRVFAHRAQNPKKGLNRLKGTRIFRMEGSGQLTPAELAYDLLLLASSLEAQGAAVEIEQEVLTLFDRYRNPLLRYAVSFGVPVPDGEEIVQEVFLSLFRHLQLGRSRQNLRGWIFRVAHNLTLKKRYANKRLPAATQEDAGIAAQQPDPRPNPEDACSEAQRQQRLLAVVRALPDVDQSCLRMRAEGLHYREIAGALGISLGSVSMSITQSLGKLIRADQR